MVKKSDIGKPVIDMIRPEFVVKNNEVYVRADLVGGAIISCLTNTGDIAGRIMGPAELAELNDK